MRGHREPDDAGIGGVGAVLVLGVVLVAVVVSASLLWMTMSTANSINDKAESIQESGRGIDTHTDAVIQLTRTDETATSILQTAEPLEGQLDEVVSLANDIAGLANSIDGTAGAIGSTASSIDSTAGAINATAAGINSEAGGILDVAGRIDTDVVNINERLDRTLGLARAIDSDTSTILTTAESIHRNAACIDQQVGGESGGDGHC